jgi:Cu/Ag efflux pump CusA
VEFCSFYFLNTLRNKKTHLGVFCSKSKRFSKILSKFLCLIFCLQIRVDRSEEKKDIDEILVLTGTSRLQAIFLTTATTVAGLTPLMMETSEQAQYLIPAAVSLAFGEIFATLITLILIPVLLKIIYMMKSSEGKNY